MGAEVTVVERDVVGGAAHLWDCIPSKTMIATGGAISFSNRLDGMGLESQHSEVDVSGLTNRIESIKDKMSGNITDILESQGVRILRGTGRFTGPNSLEVVGVNGTQTVEFDAALISTGSKPRIPEWCFPDGDRILTTRDCYPPKTFPKSVTVVGSGVTGVEFVHMFSSFGAKVTLVVSRQQVLPGKDPEVAAVLEHEFMNRGVKLVMGARAEAIERSEAGDSVIVRGVEVNKWGYVDINHHCVTNVDHIYAAGDISGKLPLSSVASIQGRKVAEHVMGLHTRNHRHLDYDKAASAIFTEPEIADVGLAEAEAFASGRKIRVTKVPFSSTAKAMINSDTRGFVKIISDPNTGEILGGSIVGRHAAELISVIAIAVTAGLTVADLVESILVHPALSEALAEAAE